MVKEYAKQQTRNKQVPKRVNPARKTRPDLGQNGTARKPKVVLPFL
jgi:hypothetical protein